MPRKRKACDPTSQAQPDLNLEGIIPYTSSMLRGDSVEHRYFADVHHITDENGRHWLLAPADTHYVRSKAQREAYKRKQEIEQGRNRSFTFSHMERIQEVIAKVPDKHCGYLLILQCYVDYHGHLINPDKSYMTREDIMRVLDVQKTVYSEFMRIMKDNGIIVPDVINGQTVYRIDQRYHWRGNRGHSIRVIKTFVDELQKLYKNVNAADLGFLYKLLPYVHYETNIICANPFENDVNWITPLNKEQIAQVTGVTEKSVYNKLRNLKLGKHYVIAEVIQGNSRYYIMNPFVFYRKPGYPDSTLRAIFSIQRNYKHTRRSSL